MSDSFFRSGGTLPLDSPSYVQRKGDLELLSALRSAEYCFVLSSRQMGKSSLAVRTVESLERSGITTAFVDLTRLGGVNVTVEQWYAGLVIEAGRALGLANEARIFLREQREFGPAQRFLSFLDEVALAEISSPVVVFLDEIDATRSLNFSTDELFAGIRQLHNGRASNPKLKRLTFCLLGVAVPGDLIRDPRTTPFNVGRRVELQDFSVEEAMQLAKALGPNGEAKLRRVIYWTAGHPFLTQSICKSLGGGDVDQLVSERYLDRRARDSDSNLADVANRLLGRGDPHVGDTERADTLSLYSRLDKGIPDDEANPAPARIKMSGAARISGGKLVNRNRIYSEVFNKAWIRDNMPGQELRRQKRALWTGVIRTATASLIVLSVVTSLAVWAIVNGNRATQSAALARKLTVVADQEDVAAKYNDYASSMQLMPFSLQRNDLDKISNELERLKGNNAKGWEWDYWYWLSHRATWSAKLGLSGTSGPISVSEDCRQAAISDGRSVFVVNILSGKIEHVIPFPTKTEYASITWMSDQGKILISDSHGRLASFDSRSGKKLSEATDAHLGISFTRSFVRSTDGRTAIVILNPVASNASEIGIVDLQTLRVIKQHVAEGDWESNKIADGEKNGTFLCFEQHGGDSSWRVTLRQKDDFKPIRSFEIPAPDSAFTIATLPNHRVVIGQSQGRIATFDTNTGALIWSMKMPDPLTDLTATKDGSQLLTGSVDGKGVLYDVLPKGIKPINFFRNVDRSMLIPDGSGVLTKRANLEFYKRGGDLNTPLAVFVPGFPGISDDDTIFQYSPTGVWQLETKKAGCKVEKVSLPVGAYDYCGPSSLCKIVASQKCTLYDLDAKKTFFKSPYLTASVLAALVSPDRSKVAIQTAENNLDLVSVATGALLWRVPIDGHDSIDSYSPNSKFLLQFDNSRSVCLRSADDARVLWSDPSSIHFGPTCSAFSANGEKVAVGDEGANVRIFEVSTGKLLTAFRASGRINGLSWNTNSTRIFTAAADRTVRVWDPGTGQELGIIDSDTSLPVAVHFDRARDELISVNYDGTVKFWMTRESRS